MDFNSIDFKYQNITGQNSDVIRIQTSFNKRNEPWYFINALPNDLTLFIKHHGDVNLSFLTIMKANQVLEFPPNKFRLNDKIYSFYRLKNKLIPFLEPYTIILQSKTIKFGAVTYTSEGGQGGPSGYYDIKGIWLNNKLPIPLDVYFKGNLVAQLYGYKGLDYFGGGASELYFDNNRQGINYLDAFEFKYSIPGKEGKYLFKVIIDDVQCMKMFIGTVSSSEGPPNPDNAVYRIKEPNYTGITYFLPIGDGKSLMTNPESPFWS